MNLEFSILKPDHNVIDFNCGINSLNDYLAKYALTNQSRRLSVTIVAQDKFQKKIIGYYTLCAAQFDSENMPKKYARSLPKYPIPAIRLCRLAIDMTCQKQGCGKDLLIHALIKSYQLSDEIGGFCVIVDALNDEAKTFYQRFGFHEFLHQTHCLFIPMQVIARLQ